MDAKTTQLGEHMRSEHGGIDTADVPGANQPQRANQQMQADLEYARRLQQEEIMAGNAAVSTSNNRCSDL